MTAAATRTPQRMCVACRTRRDKAALVRIVRRPDGEVVLDPRGDMAGRGAYLCADRECHELALKRSALQRALRSALPDELMTRLEQGDAAFGVATGYGTPETMTGGTHGA